MVEARENPFDSRSGRRSSLHEEMRRWIESAFSERARHSDAEARTRKGGEEPESEVLETEDELTAAYRDGMLAIRIPKYAISKPGRQIEITFRDG